MTFRTVNHFNSKNYINKKPKQQKPTILKIYLQNLTLNTGDMALLKCPYLINNPSINQNEKISFKNVNIESDESLNVKTVKIN